MTQQGSTESGGVAENGVHVAQTSSSTSVDAATGAFSEPGAFRVRGRLCQMLAMPLDVIMEICACLHPEDVLNLSRLSKDFREFFTSRASRPIWRSARLNFSPSPPPCPEDLTEIAYAHLLFDAFCHCCLGQNSLSISLSCRVRLCQKCRGGPKGLISYAQYCSRDYHLYDDTTKDLLKDHERVNTLVPDFDYRRRDYGRQYRPLLENFIRIWKNTSQESRKEFEEECRRKTVAIWKTVPDLAKWYVQFQKSRAREINEIRKEMLKAIIPFLIEGGWSPEVQVIESDLYERALLLELLPAAPKAQPLTPRAWSTIERPIVDYMSGVRERRLAFLYQEALNSRVRQAMGVIGEILLEMPECKVSACELAYRSRRLHDILAPQNDNFNAEDLRVDFGVLVCDYVENWEEENKRALAKGIREVVGLMNSAEPFSLAIASYLTCTSCDMLFTYRNAVRHTCRTGEEVDPPEEWLSCADYRSVLIRYAHQTHQLVWSPNPFLYNLEKTSKVIQACGFNVNSATIEDLDKKDCRLMCTNHLSSSKYIPIMDWRTAAYGDSCCQFEEYDPTYELAPEEYREAIKESEAEHRRRLDNQSLELRSYRCAHCDMFAKPRSKNVMLEHLHEEHGIQKSEVRYCDLIDKYGSLSVYSPVYLMAHECRGRDHALHDLESDHLKYRITYWKLS